MFSIENNVGRLIELRIASPITSDDMKPFQLRLRDAFGRVEGNVVLCTDLRKADVFPQDVAQAFVTMMRADNPRVLRSAFLVRDKAVFSMQIERLIRMAESPVRRAFLQRNDLCAWLGEALDPIERRRLDLFIPERVSG